MSASWSWCCNWEKKHLQQRRFHCKRFSVSTQLIKTEPETEQVNNHYHSLVIQIPETSSVPKGYEYTPETIDISEEKIKEAAATNSFLCTALASSPLAYQIKQKNYRSKRKHKAETVSKVWKIAAETRTKICGSYCTSLIRRAHYSCFTITKWGWKLRNPWRPTCFIANVRRQWLTRKTCDTFVGQS